MVTVKEELTAMQREIYALLIDEHLTVREIAKRRNVSLQAVYAQVRELVRKGWLRKEYTANYAQV